MRLILAGNGPYTNRGCEAIVRGTVECIASRFPETTYRAISVFPDDAVLHAQQEHETDIRIEHVGLEFPSRRTSRRWVAQRAARLVHRGMYERMIYRPLLEALPGCDVLLQVGGDNYTLESGGVPRIHMAIDDIALRHGVPVVLWGASVGPFDTEPAAEEQMRRHLARVHVFARDSGTEGYLRGLGLEQVHLVADPAFLMPARWSERALASGIEPPAPGAVGLNFSSLSGAIARNVGPEAWAADCACFVTTVAEVHAGPIHLVPHVAHPRHDDVRFLERVREAAVQLYAVDPARINVIPLFGDAQDMKAWISQLSAFAGARMHACIAALSSGVPTIPLAYSLKGRSLARDILDTDDGAIDLRDDARVGARRLGEMLGDLDGIRARLERRLPTMQARARRSAVLLAELVGAQSRGARA